MSFIPINGRIPLLLNQNLALQNVLRTQERLAVAANELSSGRRIFVGSDDPAKANLGAIFQSLQEQQGQFLSNVELGSNSVAVTDDSLRTIADAIESARGLAISASNLALPDVERVAQAEVVDNLLNAVTLAANRLHLDRFIFGGQSIVDTPFVSDGQGIRFTGDNGLLQTLQGDNVPFPVNVTPNGSVGTDSSAGHGGNLDPNLTAATRLAELNRGTGVARGQIVVNFGGGGQIIDLRSADDIGDVISAIDAVFGAGSAIIDGATGDRLLLDRTPSGLAGPMSITEFEGGTTAQDLGILTPTAVAGPMLTGRDLDPAVTRTTLIASLRDGAGITLGTIFINNDALDLNGNAITGEPGVPPVGDDIAVDLSTLPAGATIEDLLNLINTAGARVRAEINENQNGINVVNILAGSSYRITGIPAAELDILTTADDSALADFRNGLGIRSQASAADFQITLADGTARRFDLETGTATDLTGTVTFSTGRPVQTVLQLETIIENGFPAGNIVLGIDAATGALSITDSTVGVAFTVTDINGSAAATDLGLPATGAPGLPPVVGTNNLRARVKGVFDSLLRLRDGLLANDVNEINIGAAQLADDLDRVLSSNGRVGAQLQALDVTADRLRSEIEDAEISEAGVLEPDLTDLISNILTQQNALQASLLATSRVLEASLFDFL